MKIRKIFYLVYFLRQAKFCFTAIKSAISRCGKDIRSLNPTASTYNSDKDRPLQKKAVEGRNCIYCMGCEYYDWWHGECLINTANS